MKIIKSHDPCLLLNIILIQNIIVKLLIVIFIHKKSNYLLMSYNNFNLEKLRPA